MNKQLGLLCDVSSERDDARWAFQRCAQMVGMSFLLAMAYGPMELQLCSASALAFLALIGRRLSLHEEARRRHATAQ